jgi:hypothetical protein
MRRSTALSTLPLVFAAYGCAATPTGPQEPATPLRAEATTLATATSSSAAGAPLTSPRLGYTTATANTTGNTVTFVVTNTGAGSGTYFFSCRIGGLVTACGVATPSASIAGGASAAVDVTYSAGAEGLGTVSLLTSSAAGSDIAHYRVTIVSGTTAPPSTSSMRVSSMALQLALVKKSKGGYDFDATAKATVVDSDGNVVANATVTGDFSRGTTTYQTSASAATNTGGTATIRAVRTWAKSGEVIQFCVTNVSQNGRPYDPAANRMSCMQTKVP